MPATHTIKTFRCTRPDLYREGTMGHRDPSTRQGHYCNAVTAIEAAREMLAHYQNDTAIDVQDEDDGPWETAQAKRFTR